MKQKIRRPAAVNILLFLLLFIGIVALASGAMLFLAPSGKLLGMSVDILQGTLFNSYLIPGIILFVFVGIFPVLVWYSLLKRPNWRWAQAINPLKNYHWAWTASIKAGIIMLIWIITETILLGYISFLQPLIVVWGILLIVLTVIPPVRRFYRVSESSSYRN